MSAGAVEVEAPSLAEIEEAHARMRAHVIETPVVALASDRIAPLLPDGAELIMKLEVFQHAGSFKARGAMLNVLALDAEGVQRGITAVSAGNHAIAAAWAARKRGTHAKVVMMQSADPVRVAACRALGAEVIQTPDVHAAFAEVERIVRDEGRTFVHPFEGRLTVTGTATLGLEMMRQTGPLDAVVIPVGGGGLIAGMARAIRLMQPDALIFGVEPEGADSMARSFAAGSPQKLEAVRTIADSLGAPMALPYSFAVARASVDEIVRIPDAAMLKSMAHLFDALKLAVEPAGAASTAAVIGPLRERLAGKRIAVIACGSNIGEERYGRLLAEGRAML
jgi:threonine dehydratase